MKNNVFQKLIFILLLIVSVNGCTKSAKQQNSIQVEEFNQDLEEQLYRPNFHFTPKANWMNDPNGMFYLNGTYHLYFQYYPSGNVWGPMHWGHATSASLFNWTEHNIALYPDEKGFIFSGSAVVDKNNSSGLGEDGVAPVVAFFTYHDMNAEKEGKDYQSQAISYSLDEGMTWTKFDQNPVIPNPGIKDFRDPKVIWQAESSKWIMCLAAGDRIMFYSSTNLTTWKLESEFGNGIGAHGGVWECPDLFPLKVNNGEDHKWVLLVSINPGGPNGGSATQYFIGDFDGKKFNLNSEFSKQLEKENAIWLDYGRDNYAGVTWSNIPEDDGRTLFIGWMSNWDYARNVPTFKWRSAMTIPRHLSLTKTDGKYCLQNEPVRELDNFVEETKNFDSVKSNELNQLFKEENIDLTNLNLKLNLVDLQSEIYKINFFNSVGDTLIVGLNNNENALFVDRRNSGKVGFSEKFAPNVSRAHLNKKLDSINLQIILDKTSIEVFINGGEKAMTEIFFPNELMQQFSITSKDSIFKIRNMKVQKLKFD